VVTTTRGADLLVREPISHGAPGACVDVGGDAHVAGTSPRPGGRRLSIASPRGPLSGGVTPDRGALAGAHGGVGGIRSVFVAGVYAWAARTIGRWAELTA
jgi:hypothetical protein